MGTGAEANAFAGRNGYADVGANPSSAEGLLSDMAAGTSAYLSGEAKARTVVAFVADDLSRKELNKYGATRLQWLQQQFKDAASSLVIPSFVAHKVVKQDLVRFVNFDAEQSSVAEIVASVQTPTSNARVIAVRVPSILAESRHSRQGSHRCGGAEPCGRLYHRRNWPYFVGDDHGSARVFRLWCLRACRVANTEASCRGLWLQLLVHWSSLVPSNHGWNPCRIGSYIRLGHDCFLPRLN